MASIRKRSTKSGTSYTVTVRKRGHPPATATFKRLSDAKCWAKQTEAAILEGRYFQTAEAGKHTVAELLERYQAEVLVHKSASMQAGQAGHIRFWTEKIGAYRLDAVSPALLAEIRGRMLREPRRAGRPLCNASVNRYFAVLRHAFSVAVDEWQWLEESPTKKVKKLKEPRGRTRFLSDEERRRLLAACKEERQDLADVVLLALTTAARKSELLDLRWPDVDLQQKRITFQQTKNGEIRSVPLPAPALEVLRRRKSERRRIDTDRVFPGHGDRQVRIDGPWKRALDKAGIEDFRFHDLRHSAASYLAMNGASLLELSQILGHRTLEMVKRNSHLTEQHTASILERTSKRMFE